MEEERNKLQARLLRAEEQLDTSKRKCLTLEERLNRFSARLDDIEIEGMDPIIDLLSRSRSYATCSEDWRLRDIYISGHMHIIYIYIYI